MALFLKPRGFRPTQYPAQWRKAREPALRRQFSSLQHAASRTSREIKRYETTVRSKLHVADHIKLFTLNRPANFSYLPGQWIDVYWRPNGNLPSATHPGADEITTGFSMISEPLNPDTLEFAIKETRHPIVRWLHREVSHIQLIISEAQGTMAFPYPKELVRGNPKRPLVLIAGGIGLTPLLSIVSYLHHRKKAGLQISGDPDPSHVWFIHQAVDLTGLVFKDKLKAMRNDMPELITCYWTVTGHHSRPDSNAEIKPVSAAKDHPVDTEVNTGPITKATINTLGIPIHESVYYICGPLGMIQSLQNMLTKELAVDPDYIITEKWV